MKLTYKEYDKLVKPFFEERKLVNSILQAMLFATYPTDRLVVIYNQYSAEGIYPIDSLVDTLVCIENELCFRGV